MSLLSRLTQHVHGQAIRQGGRIEPLTQKVQQVAELEIAPDFLRGILDTHDRATQHSRSGKEGYIHVSSLIGFCARRQVLLRDHADPQDGHTSTNGGMQVLWALGRAAETHVRKQIIADRRADVYGIWKCACERSEHVGFWASRSCAKCETPLNTYHEHPLADDEAGVIGNPDLLLRVADKIMVVEVKSMNKKEWDKIEAPKGDHIFQAGWYVNILRRKGFQVYDNARVIYVAKDYLFGSPYKEFPFNACTPARLAMIEDSRIMAMAAHNAQTTNRLPPRTMCESYQTKTAKECPACVACFNRS